MSSLKLCVAAMAWTGAALWSHAAIAEPPQSVYYDSATPFVVCDTKAQISEVVQALEVHKLKEKLAEFGKQIDANKEPVCLFSAVGPVIFGASEHVGLIFDHDEAIDLWISEVRNAHVQFYLLWGEIGKETSV